MGRARGRELAGLVLAQKQARPDMPVSLVGHSAGSFVVLVAAEQLPPDTLERIVLLSPSVSSGYDVRPALPRPGTAWMSSIAPTTGSGSAPSRPWLARPTTPSKIAPRVDSDSSRNWRAGEDPLFTKLRQYEWNPSIDQTGNDGGHYGAYQPGHLRKFVLPLFQY